MIGSRGRPPPSFFRDIRHGDNNYGRGNRNGVGMAATLEIVQEGSLRVLSGRPKTPSSIYDYRIQANGSLKIGNLHKQHDLTIDLLSYNFVDICEELMIGGFLVKLVKGETDEVLLVFETPLALQTFCFGCYKLCKSEKLKVL